MIAGCEKMGRLWGSAAEGGQKEGEGYVAYAHQKAAMFRKMAQRSRELFKDKKVCGGWPGEGESLTEYLRACRPSLLVDWAQVATRMAKDPALAEIPGIRLGDESSDDGDLEGE